jgi:hypothetical protein
VVPGPVPFDLPQLEEFILGGDGRFGQAADGMAEEVNAGGEVEEGRHGYEL